MKPGKGSKYHNWYQTFRIRSFPYAGRPRLCRKRGRNITESPPFFQYENFLFGHHKTFSLSLLSQNACHHVLKYRIGVHLPFFNSAVRQLLASLWTFWCFSFVFVLLLLLLDDRNDVKEADFKPRFAVPALCRRRKNFVRVFNKEEEHGLSRNGKEWFIGLYYWRKSPYLSTIMWGLLSKQRLTVPNRPILHYSI